MIFKTTKRAAQLLLMIHKGVYRDQLVLFIIYKERFYLYITWIELYINMNAAKPEGVERFPGNDLCSKALCVL